MDILPGRVAMVLPGLIVSGMILRLCHFCREFLQLIKWRKFRPPFVVPGKIEKEETTVIDNIECDFLGQSKQNLLKSTR